MITKKGNNSNEKIEITERMKEVVLAKIDAQVPSNMRLFVGSSYGMNKEEIMEHVKKVDEIGKEIIMSHIKFMRAVASGEFTKAISSV